MLERLLKRSIRILMGTALLMVTSRGPSVLADEGGVSFWLPGQYGSFAAVAPAPGWSLPLVFYNYGGSIGADRQLRRGHLLTSGLSSSFDGIENPSTNYTNGIDLHLDLGAAQFLTEHFFIGAVGYYYQQLTADRGQLPVLGPNESRTRGIGPQIGYNFSLDGVTIYKNLRG